MKLQSIKSDGILDHETSRSEALVAKNVVETCNLGRRCIYGIYVVTRKRKGEKCMKHFEA